MIRGLELRRLAALRHTPGTNPFGGTLLGGIAGGGGTPPSGNVNGNGIFNSPKNPIPYKQNVLVPQGAINITLPVILLATNTPQPCVPYQVPRQAVVNIRAANGTNTGNQFSVYVGQSPSECMGTSARQISPDSEINYPVDNTGQIWVRGTAADGIQVYVTAQPIG